MGRMSNEERAKRIAAVKAAKDKGDKPMEEEINKDAGVNSTAANDKAEAGVTTPEAPAKVEAPAVPAEEPNLAKDDALIRDTINAAGQMPDNPRDVLSPQNCPQDYDFLAFPPECYPLSAEEFAASGMMDCGWGRHEKYVFQWVLAPTNGQPDRQAKLDHACARGWWICNSTTPRSDFFPTVEKRAHGWRWSGSGAIEKAGMILMVGFREEQEAMLRGEDESRATEAPGDMAAYSAPNNMRVGAIVHDPVFDGTKMVPGKFEWTDRMREKARRVAQ